MWIRIRALVVKEFLAILKDPRSRGMIFLLPVVQIGLFPLAANFDVLSVPVAVWNEDGGKTAENFLSEVFGSPVFKRSVDVVNADQAQRALDDQDVKLSLHIASDFSRHIAQGRPAPVQAVVDGRNSNTALIVLGYLGEVTERFNAAVMAEDPSRAGRTTLELRAWFNPGLESTWFFVPGLLALIIMIAVFVITAFSVSREKEAGTFQQLLATPLRPFEILVGKLIPAFCVGIFETLVIIGLARLLYGIPFRGDIGLLLLAVMAFLLAIAAIGVTISTLSRTQQQALLGGFFCMVPMIVLSGFATPIENMPQALQWLTCLNPVRYMVDVARGLFLKDVDAGVVFSRIWPMGLIAFVNMAIAMRMFRKRLS